MKDRRSQSLKFSSGAGLSEYGIILGLVAVIGIGVLMTMGDQMNGLLNPVNQQGMGQVDRLVSTLEGPSNGATTSASGVAQPAPNASGTPRSIQIGNQTVNYQFNPTTGRIELGTSGDTTAAEGLVTSIAEHLYALANDPNRTEAATVPADKLRALASLARNVGTGQNNLLARVDVGQSGAPRFNALNQGYQEFNDLAEDITDPAIRPLAKLVSTIAYQNYLKPYQNQYGEQTQPPPEGLLLEGVPRTANSQDTFEAADTIDQMTVR
jgi:Flp pilus assembly pilin Flp